MKKNRILVSLLLFMATILVRGQEVEIKTTKLTESIYMLEGRGGNIGVFVGEDGVFMIDDQYAPLTPKILAAIKKITEQPVDYLINTHWHGDHTGGNENMGNAGALIVSHKNVRKRMHVDQLFRGKVKKAAPKIALPVITFEKDITFHLNGDTILISHLHNAHTDGDAFVYFVKNNVIHAGDVYFQGKFPFIDLESGGSIDGYIQGIKKMIMLSDDATKIIPGHGKKVSNKEVLKEYLEMLKTLRNRIQTEINKGKTMASVVSNKEITKEFTSYNGWITAKKIRGTIYKSLKDIK